MESLVAAALGNLTSPMVLFFALGLGAALVRSDLAVPEAIAKGLALYLLLAIGFKGGAAMAESGVDGSVLASLAAGIVLSFALPVVGFALLRLTSRLPATEAAAVAAHYGSISVVTFVAANQMVADLGLAVEGHLVAVAAAMEAPAVATALWLASRSGRRDPSDDGERGGALRHALVNGSIVLLVGAFVVGWISGPAGFKDVSPFIVDPFKGVLCLFLLDMGLVAGRGLVGGGRSLDGATIAFGLYMPLISAAVAAAMVPFLGLGAGGAAVLITLAASESYIAVPAAMRLSLPEARPEVYLTLSLGVTFPFNLMAGIPIYIWIAGVMT